MKTYLISDDENLLLGFKLAGNDGSFVNLKEDDVKEVFEQALKKENLGVLVMTDTIYKMIKQDVLEHRSKGKTPLTVALPGRKQ